jgi:hypothetical protein
LLLHWSLGLHLCSDAASYEDQLPAVTMSGMKKSPRAEKLLSKAVHPVQKMWTLILVLKPRLASLRVAIFWNLATQIGAMVHEDCAGQWQQVALEY